MSTSELPRIGVSVVPARYLRLSPSVEHLENGAPIWSAEAPARIVKHFLAGNEREAWRAWKKRLARCEFPWAGARLAKISTAELLQWGCSDEQLDDPTRTAIDALFVDGAATADMRQQAIESVLTAAGNGLDQQAALVHLACVYAMPALAAALPHRQWWELLGRFVQTARDAAVLELSSAPLLHQWLAGELPVALATLFPELSACAELLPHGRRAISAGVDELLDGEGMPHRRYLDIHWPVLACWTRVRSMIAASGESCCDDVAESQYPFAVREMLRLADYRGGSLFVDSPARELNKVVRFFAEAVKLSGDKENRAALRNLHWNALKAPYRGTRKRLPSTANHSEWAQVAVLRSAWKRSSPRLGVTYGDRSFRGELAIGREKMFTGDWPFTVMVDGRGSRPMDDWEAICWVSDEDVDYLEVEIELDEGLKLQRQLCLARKDRFLFVADAVLGPSARPLCHSLSLPLGGNVEAVLSEETREVVLRAGRTKALVLPLSLPEWRVDRRFGELAARSDRFELQQNSTGASLYAPLWIDLDPDRGRKPFTWRQLTVAEERRIVPRDEAVGYRIQFGKKQWLIYRSLTPRRNRTVLGHNLATDFLIARFGRDGSVRSLIEVE